MLARSLSLSLLALPAFTLAVQAADLPQRLPEPPPMPILFTWAGPYAGVHAAYGWGQFDRYNFNQDLVKAAIPAHYKYAGLATSYAQQVPSVYDSEQWGGGFLPDIILCRAISSLVASLITPPFSEHLARVPFAFTPIPI